MASSIETIDPGPSAASTLHIEYWPITRLRDYERNPRKNDHAVAQMVASIHESGFPKPEDLDRPLELLVEHNYLLRLPLRTGGPGRKPSPAFVVNPLWIRDSEPPRPPENGNSEYFEYSELTSGLSGEGGKTLN